MAKVHCSLCGATGHSKNPATRTVFPDNQADALLSHILKFPKIEAGRAEGKISFYCDTVEDYFTNLISAVELLKRWELNNTPAIINGYLMKAKSLSASKLRAFYRKHAYKHMKGGKNESFYHQRTL